jgi:Cu(I)/Ag(I) efflux system membrane fusion protein
MNRTYIILFLLIIVVGLVAVVAGYNWGMKEGMSMSTPVSDSGSVKLTEDPSTWSIAEGEAATRRHMEAGLKSGDVDPVTGSEILFYQDPMVPGNKFETPGKSPYMDMMLVPAYKGHASDESGNDNGVSISSRIQQNIGMRTAEVKKESIATHVNAVGTIAWNERGEVDIQARAMGYVEKLYVRATLDQVEKGQPLLAIYVPEWVAIQEEFLALKKMRGEGLDDLVEAAFSRMRQAGMSEAQIRQVEQTERLHTQLTITSPIDGVVTELVSREGMSVSPGLTLMRINTLDSVWANAEIPESQVELLKQGDPITATSPAFPGKSFDGHIQRLLPEVEPTTRTMKARMVLANPDNDLVPGMFVNMDLAGKQINDALMIPTESLIRTGKRTLVMVTTENGGFRPVEVTPGRVMGGKTEIKEGLDEGQRVVTSGQFLVDSEASLRGVEARLSNPTEMEGQMDEMPAMESNTHHTQAKIEAINGAMLTLTHPDIPSLEWPGMTMDFELSPELQSNELSVGEEIGVEFRLENGSAPLIVDIYPSTSGHEMEGAQ